MNIGAVIKKLRRERDITQEKFAEYLSVSPQAVSRWENGAAYPDIATIPAVATFFGVSTDLLLGVDEDRREALVNEYLNEYQDMNAAGEREKKFELIKEAKEKFPGDFRILIKYAWALSETPYAGLDGECIMTSDEFAACQQEIIGICQNIIEDCTVDEIRYGAIDLLCQAYLELGDAENAEKAANCLPSMNNSRESVLYRLYDYDTEEHKTLFQDTIQSLTGELWLWIRSVCLGTKEPEKKVALCKKTLAVFEIMYENGDYGYYHCMLAQVQQHIVMAYIELGDADSALDALEKMTEHYIAYIQLPTVCTHTSMLFDHLNFDRSKLSVGGTWSTAEVVLHDLARDKYDSIRDSDRFHAIEDKLRKYM